MSAVNICDFSIGSIIDNTYKVVKILGEGSFGKVYKVIDCSNNIYALKILKLWLMDSQMRQNQLDRYEMEFETGKISCPYLVHSVSKGIVDGNPYIVMEFCPNGDLTNNMQNSDWNIVAHQILYGLKALHQCGKVHRDLKPANVLVKENGNVALTDFGICGDRNKRMTERNIFGGSMQKFGTYAYMPPEQIYPMNGDATVLPTTDIFSFGVMMYQVLVGHLPFGPLSSEEDLVNYVHKSRTGIWYKSDLSKSSYGKMFKPVISGCLEPDFEKRLQSVDDVLKLLPEADVESGLFKPMNIPSKINGYLLRVMQGEEYGTTYDLTELHRNNNVITIGRKDYLINNIIQIKEEQSRYISRRHCSLEFDLSSRMWYIRDGQWNVSFSKKWESSLNGTYVNSKSVGKNGVIISLGDIISIGDVKLRFEAY